MEPAHFLVVYSYIQITIRIISIVFIVFFLKELVDVGQSCVLPAMLVCVPRK